MVPVASHLGELWALACAETGTRARISVPVWVDYGPGRHHTPRPHRGPPEHPKKRAARSDHIIPISDDATPDRELVPRRRKQDGVYAKIFCSLLGHPKMIRAQDEDPLTFELYVKALLWSKQYETDGHIPFGAIERMGVQTMNGHLLGDTAETLVKAGLWKEYADGWGVKDYGEYQVTKHEREKLSTRAKKAAKTRWSTPPKPSRSRSQTPKTEACNKHATSMPDPMPNTDTDTDTEIRTKTRSRAASSTTISEVWNAYTHHHPKAVFTTTGKNNRKGIIDRALRNYHPTTLIAAIHGNHLDPWCNGQNDTGHQHHDIELILRDAAHIERYSAIHQAATSNGRVAQEDMDALIRQVDKQRGYA